MCNNFPGNYTCSCQDGYAGDPYTGVRIMSSCKIFGNETKYFMSTIIWAAKTENLYGAADFLLIFLTNDILSVC